MVAQAEPLVGLLALVEGIPLPLQRAGVALFSARPPVPQSLGRDVGVIDSRKPAPGHSTLAIISRFFSAGGLLDNFINYKPNWWESPDGCVMSGDIVPDALIEFPVEEQ